MKKASTVVALAALFAWCFASVTCYAQVSAGEGAEEGAAAVARDGAAPPPAQYGQAGVWTQVPGESIEGRWIPPHWVWVPATAPVRPAPPPVYGPVPVPYAMAPYPNFGTVLADIIFLRPLGIAGLALGTAATIVATPFALPSGSMGQVSRALIVEPYDFTFRRPLGVW